MLIEADVVTVLGRAGGLELTVNDVATRAEVSPYELLVGLRLRQTEIGYPVRGWM